MLVWQVVEQHLGAIWVTSKIGELEMATERNLTKRLRQTLHVATRATAASMLRDLKPTLEAELHAELSKANEWRDLLAHRYLRERVRGSLARGHFLAGTSEELGELYDWFLHLAVELERLVVQNERDLADEMAEVDDELVDIIERIGRAVLRAEPLNIDDLDDGGGPT